MKKWWRKMLGVAGPVLNCAATFLILWSLRLEASSVIKIIRETSEGLKETPLAEVAAAHPWALKSGLVALGIGFCIQVVAAITNTNGVSQLETGASRSRISPT